MQKLTAAVAKMAALAGALAVASACSSSQAATHVRYTGTCGPANSLNSASADLIILSSQPARVDTLTVTWSNTLGKKTRTVPIHRTIKPNDDVTVPIPLVTIKGYMANCQVTSISARASG